LIPAGDADLKNKRLKMIMIIPGNLKGSALLTKASDAHTYALPGEQSQREWTVLRNHLALIRFESLQGLTSGQHAQWPWQSNKLPATEQSTHEVQVAHDAESNARFVKLFSTVSITEYSIINQDSTTSLRVTDKPDLDEENEIRRDAREAGFVLESVVSGHAQAAELAIKPPPAVARNAFQVQLTCCQCDHSRGMKFRLAAILIWSQLPCSADPFILRQGNIMMVSSLVSKVSSIPDDFDARDDSMIS